MSVQRSWGCASLAITLTTPEFDFFIQPNPARGKSKEKQEQKTPKGQKFKWIQGLTGQKNSKLVASSYLTLHFAAVTRRQALILGDHALTQS